MSIDQLPTYFLSHGGGPWSFVEEPRRQNYANLEQSLIALRPELQSPVRAVLIISGHWEERGFAISSAAKPGMLFDYGVSQTTSIASATRPQDHPMLPPESAICWQRVACPSDWMVNVATTTARSVS
ncbi:hypothetical protein HDE77_000296 [Rhodanobacter sp. MP7CTX1]|nr:hypothetical protein [Rhodanobacter sp. MP7CTX1]